MMPRVTNPIALLVSLLRQTLSIRLLFLFSCVTLGILWIESSIQVTNENLGNEKPKYLKYILLWTSDKYYPFRNMGKGQGNFIRFKCSVINCYITTDRNFFGGDVTKFDAIAFNGCNIRQLKRDRPTERSDHQKYIFSGIESADIYPVCNEVYDNYFNWTATYRLDSTILSPYFLIKNEYGEVVGPRRDMKWVDKNDIDEMVPYVHNKSKAAAWFVSNCASINGREEFVKSLQRALSSYGLTVDVYGACGKLYCPKFRDLECLKMLERDYYFYLALENSFDEDYITEKVLTALQYNAVPIVYGGANYSRFLPPHSYLDGRRITPKKLAAMMANIINSKDLYQSFFWWKPYYSYFGIGPGWICDLCSALHNSSLINTYSAYKEFRQWWYPDYKKRC